MKNYSITEEARAHFRKMPRRVQGAIAQLANRKLGIETDEPEGIYKCEGGVKVNGKEIAIKRDYVMDDWGPRTDGTPEEESVIEAIAEVEHLVLAGDDLGGFADCIMGNTLLEMMR